MRVAIAQINTKPADLEATSQRVLACARQAAEKGAGLAIFPMAALCGPTPVGPGSQEPFLTDLLEALTRISDESPIPCMVPIVCDMDGDPLPEVMLLGEGAVIPLKFLSYIQGLDAPDAAGAGSDEGAAAGLPVIELDGLRFGIASTYEDLDDYDAAPDSIDVLVYIAGYPFAWDDPSSVLAGDLSRGRYVDDARSAQAWLVCAGSLGGYGTQVFSGSSFVMSPDGGLVASSPAFEEDLLIADVGDADAGGEDPSHRVLPASWPRDAAAAAGQMPEVYDAPLHLWRALTMGVHDYLDKMGRHEAVVPLDGTLSSQALAVLATDALGPANVHAMVCVPGDDAAAGAMLQLARNLRIDARRLPARAIAASVANPEPGAELTPTLARGILVANVAAWADELGAVALSPEDKTWLALGRDINAPSAAALAPLGDVYRSDVLRLARMRNTISPVFPAAVLGERDVIDLDGVSREGYSPETWTRAIDAVLAGHIEWERDATALASTQGQDAGLVQAVLDALAATEPARVGRSLYLMSSSRTLFDARVPLGLAWRDHVRAQGEDGEDEELATFLERLEGLGSEPPESDDADAGGDGAPAEPEPKAGASKRFHDLLGYLHDFSLGGGFRPDGFGGGPHDGASGGRGSQGPEGLEGLAGGPDAPDMPAWGHGASQGHGELPDDWHSPFSEN